MLPLSLYIHFPWCVKKCPYCDFNSHPRRGQIDQAAYITALLRDLDADLARFGCTDRRLVSIFMGGGTPSLFGHRAMSRLLREIRARIGFAADLEISMEANPGALEYDDFAAYRAAGINRLSLGAQSFHDPHLKILGRIHASDEIHTAIRAAKSAGFDNFNLDLMYGLPQQTPAQAAQDLRHALEYQPPHLSLYALTLEPNTYFHRYPPALPDPDAVAAMHAELHQYLTTANYQRYEVSAYAQSGRTCVHNRNYWEFGDYLGIGAGAHGKITTSDQVTRYAKPKHPVRYQQTAGHAAAYHSRRVAGDELVFEFLLNRLRLRGGFSPKQLGTRLCRSNSDAETAVRRILAESAARGLVEIHADRIVCSRSGYLFLDEILQGILPDAD